MENIVQSDIFFFMSTIFFLCFFVMTMIILFKIDHIITNIKNIVNDWNKQSKETIKDIDIFKRTIKNKGNTLREIYNFLFSESKPKKNKSYGTKKN